MRNSSSQFSFKLMTTLSRSSKCHPPRQERLCLQIREANQYQCINLIILFPQSCQYSLLTQSSKSFQQSLKRVLEQNLHFLGYIIFVNA